MKKGACIGIVMSALATTPTLRAFDDGFDTTVQTGNPRTAPVKRVAAPVGATVQCTIDVEGTGPSEYGQHELHDVGITVLEVVHGNKAWELIQAADASNRPPDTGFDYLLARIRFEYSVQGPQGNMPYVVNRDCFKLYSSDNKEYTAPSITSAKPELIGREFYPGSSYEGWVPFMAAVNDEPVLFYPQGGVWFQF